jgi:hypothetical protein
MCDVKEGSSKAFSTKQISDPIKKIQRYAKTIMYEMFCPDQNGQFLSLKDSFRIAFFYVRILKVF